MKAEFEESQFAVFFQDDLTHRVIGWDVVLAPIGQVLEARLGFDLGAWLPPFHPIWGTLHGPALPGMSRAGWNPNMTPRTAVTSKAINLFFQFKRSDYLQRSNATYYGDFGGPYWRFRIDRTDNPGSQPRHDLLEALETRTAGSALVRYVPPVCHQYAALEGLCDSRSLLEQCVYVAPWRFAPARTTCLYTDPANVKVNPDAESIEVDDWAQLQEKITGLAEQAQGIEALIAQTTETVASLGARQLGEIRYPWRLPRNMPFEIRSLLEPYLPAAEWMFRANVNWIVALIPERAVA